MTHRLQAALAVAALIAYAGTSPAADDAKSGPQPNGSANKTPADKSSADKKAGDAKTDSSSTKAEPKKSKIEYATFGGGCFWSMEAIFERIPGVRRVASGFSGGTVANPSYALVCTGQTGHAEVIQVEYDSSVVSYEKLLKAFFTVHNPTTLNSQGDDFGTNYRSVIFYHDEAQKEAALKMYKELTAKKVFRAPIVTELAPFFAFYPAEPYHQDYFRNHPYSDYSQFYIIPKLKKYKSKLHLR
ncbi:MAG: peptide-methionine (S)-S-oxide reductase MsrA [Planctomycetota bacterium]|nr:peptide-methionine (S)-S-oxide reductase MsrA [Planctomycetota bacterium]